MDSAVVYMLFDEKNQLFRHHFLDKTRLYEYKHVVASNYVDDEIGRSVRFERRSTLGCHC